MRCAERQRDFGEVKGSRAIAHAECLQAGTRDLHRVERVRDHLLGKDAVHDRAHQLALPRGTADVAERVAVAHARKRERGVAVGKVASRGPRELRAPVVYVGVVTQRDAAERVNKVRDSRETHFHICVDREARELLNRDHEQLRAALGERRVDLVRVVARNLDVGVAGNRDQRRHAVRCLVKHHDRVGARARGAVVVFPAVSRVRTDDEVGLPGRIRSPAERVNVLNARVDPHPRQRRDGDRDDKHNHQRGYTAPSKAARLARGWGLWWRCWLLSRRALALCARRHGRARLLVRLLGWRGAGVGAGLGAGLENGRRRHGTLPWGNRWRHGATHPRGHARVGPTPSGSHAASVTRAERRAHGDALCGMVPGRDEYV